MWLASCAKCAASPAAAEASLGDRWVGDGGCTPLMAGHVNGKPWETSELMATFMGKYGNLMNLEAPNVQTQFNVI